VNRAKHHVVLSSQSTSTIFKELLTCFGIHKNSPKKKKSSEKVQGI
jgi:hypothetical protein